MEQMKPSQEDAMVRRFMMKKLLTHSASMFLFAVQVKNTVKYIATHKKKSCLHLQPLLLTISSAHSTGTKGNATET